MIEWLCQVLLLMGGKDCKAPADMFNILKYHNWPFILHSSVYHMYIWCFPTVLGVDPKAQERGVEVTVLTRQRKYEALSPADFF